MCVNPIFVAGSSVSPLPEHSRSVRNFVPCGRCHECCQQIVDGYVTRCVAEYLHVKKNGGCTFYYTLTYNDAYIPKYKGINCFNVKDVQKFIKRLRYHLDKLGVHFTYFLTSEFGHETYRAHYHILFFLDKSFSRTKFHDIISKLWFFGFNCPGDNTGFVDSVIALKYCCKYVAKDSKVFDYLEKKGISRSVLENNINSDYKRKTGISLLPFHLQSVGLGACICDYLKDDDLINGKFVINDTLGLCQEYHLPLYILRKLCYKRVLNKNGNVSYILNDYGIKIKKLQILKSVEPLAKEYEVLFSLLPHYYDKSDYLKKFAASSDELVDMIYRINHGMCDFVDLACYKLFYHRFYDKYDLFFNSDFETSLDLYFDNYLNEFPFYNVVDRSNVFNSWFYGFELLLNIFSNIKSYIKYDKYKKNVKAYNLSQMFRSMSSGKYCPLDILDYSVYCDLKTYSPCSNIQKIRLPNWCDKHIKESLFSQSLMESLF